MGIECLRLIPIFATFSDADLHTVMGMGRIVHVAKGTLLFAEGDQAHEVFFPKAGSLRVYRMSEDGRELTLDIPGPGSIVGPEAFLPGETYRTTAAAFTDVCVLGFTRPAVDELFRRYPELGLKAVQSMSRALSDATEALARVALMSARERVMAALERLAGTYGRGGRTGVCLDLALTHQDMASLTGLSRQTVTTVLSELRSEGRITVLRRRIWLKEPEMAS